MRLSCSTLIDWKVPIRQLGSSLIQPFETCQIPGVHDEPYFNRESGRQLRSDQKLPNDRRQHHQPLQPQLPTLFRIPGWKSKPGTGVDKG